jgi:hypothetical protein
VCVSQKLGKSNRMLAADLARQTVERSMRNTATMLASATPDFLSPIHSAGVSRSTSGLGSGLDPNAGFAFDMDTIVGALDRSGRARRSTDLPGEEEVSPTAGSRLRRTTAHVMEKLSSVKVVVPGVSFERHDDIPVPLARA